MTDKKQAEERKPVKTVRKGAIGASIWRGTAAEGLTYYSMSLGRSWLSKNSGKTGYSQKFFSQNREALKEVVDMACDAIEDLEQAEAATKTEELAA